MSKKALILPVGLALFGALILAFLIAGELSEASMVWWAYLLPLFCFVLAVYTYAKEGVKVELIRAMQARNVHGHDQEQLRTSESTDELPAPTRLTVQIFTTATPLPEGADGAVHFARIQECKNSVFAQMRAVIRPLAWHSLAIAILAALVSVRNPLAGMFWLAIPVTLFVTRRRALGMPLVHRLSVLTLTYWFWFCATAIASVSCLAAAGMSSFIPVAALKPFGVALLGIVALRSTWHRRRRIAFGKPEGADARRYNLLFLWVFKSGGSVWNLLGGICQDWTALGRTRLLGGGEFLGADDWRVAWDWLRGRSVKVVIQTPEELDERMKPAVSERQTTSFDTFVCHDRIWKLALDRLLGESDIVFMNLSGLSDSNQGCLYEIEVLINRVALSRVVFLIDKATDVGYVKKVIEDVWRRQRFESVNRFGPPTTVWLVQLSTSMAEQSEGKRPDTYEENDQADALMAVVVAEQEYLVRLLCAALERGGARATAATVVPL